MKLLRVTGIGDVFLRHNPEIRLALAIRRSLPTIAQSRRTTDLVSESLQSFQTGTREAFSQLHGVSAISGTPGQAWLIL
jgi:hypothetical protein